MARAGRCAVLSSVSDDLAPPALAVFEETVYPYRKTPDLDRGGPFDFGDDPSGVAILVSPRRDQRMATAVGSCLGFGIVSASAVLLFLRRREMPPTQACLVGLNTAYLANAAVCLVVYSEASGSVRSRSGWLVAMVVVWPMVLELIWIFIHAFRRSPR